MLYKIKLVLLSIKRRGINNTLKMIISEIIFDSFNKVNTSDIVNLNTVTVKRDSIEDCSEYCPLNKIILDHIFSYLNKNYNFKNSIFLDYGCGKGRVLIYAKKFKFKKIIGVEFANEFCNIAKQNIESLGLKDIEIFQEDATKYKIPINVNIFYFYNPFIGEVMEKVINNIDKHKETFKGKILVIYVNPICKDLFLDKEYSVVYDYKDEVIVFEK